MTYKKSATYFLIIVIICTSFLPIVNISIGIFENTLSFNDNKKKLFSTDKCESYLNYVVYKLFNKSLVEKNVIAGRDNFLFLGNGFNNVLKKTQGIDRPSKTEIDKWSDKLKFLQQQYESKGIKFIIVIAPNKESVYKDKLPSGMNYNGKTITDDIVESALNKNINMLDLRSLLEKEKYSNNELLYFKTDTHWNMKGASLGFESTINFINDTYKINIEKLHYTLQLSSRGGGDLTRFLKIKDLLSSTYDNDFSLIFEKNIEVCKGNINKDNGSLEKCFDTPNPITDINAQPQYIINKGLKGYRLLLLCDSFGVAPSQLYNASFNTIWKWHYDQLNGEKLSKFIDDNKPDIVIYQIIERALYDWKSMELPIVN